MPRLGNGNWPLTIAIIGTVVSITAIGITVVAYGANESSTPILMSVITTISLVLTTLAGVWKSTDAAHKSAVAAKKADAVTETTEGVKRTTELTASQIAALRQEILSDREVCLHHECPRKAQALARKVDADVT